MRIFRPEDFGSVGTFAGIQVSDEFARLHPGAVEDWVRAVVAATEWAVDHPDETVRIAERMCGDSCGEFSIEHELFRFTEELNLSLASTPDGHVFGAIHEPTVRAELEAMAGFGIIETVPDPRVLFDNRYVDAVHDGNGDLIWECVAPTCRAPR